MTATSISSASIHNSTASLQRPGQLEISSIPAYEVLVQQQENSRGILGRMLLNWRRYNGWTQYTPCTWAETIGEPRLVVSYGNLSVIEHGKAGELRHRAFWQLWELNWRVASGDWGHVGNAELRRNLEDAIPLGDEASLVWGPLEFWSCYCGLRPLPPPLPPHQLP